MSILRNATLLFLIGAFIATSCDDSDPEDDFPNNIGIVGRVNAQNEFEQPLWEERNNVQVLLQTGFRSFDVQGDNTGNFHLGGAPIGSYTITYSKPEFGKRIIRGINISTTNPAFPVENGAQRIPTVMLTKLPLTEFDNVQVNLDETGGAGNYELTVTATMVPGPPANGSNKGYRVFIGTSAQVSNESYDFQAYGTTAGAALELSFGDELFNKLNIQSGDLIYVTLHGDANFDQSEEFPTGVFRFPNITQSGSDIVSVVLP